MQYQEPVKAQDGTKAGGWTRASGTRCQEAGSSCLRIILRLQPPRALSDVISEPVIACFWRLRPAATFDVSGGAISVLMDGEIAGELEFAPPLDSILLDLVKVQAGENSDEDGIVRHLGSLGHADDDIRRLLDILVQAGLAGRHNLAIPAPVATHIAEWTSHIDEAVVQIRESRVLLAGQDTHTKELLQALSVWSIAIEPATMTWEAARDWTCGEHPPALIIGWLGKIQDLQMVQWCAINDIPFLPLREDGHLTRIGPVFIRDASPCPFCAPHFPPEPLMQGVAPPNPAHPVGWSRIANAVADFLAGRPGAEDPFLQHVLDREGRYLAGHPASIEPRCPVCSRLNRFPENAVIHV